MQRQDPWKLAAIRRLRRNATDAERRLWSHLRRSPQCHWRRQRPVLGYVLDFYCARAALGIELDGGQHFEPLGLKLDRLRDEDLEKNGVRVLRFDNSTVLERTREVVEEIWRVCDERVKGDR